MGTPPHPPPPSELKSRGGAGKHCRYASGNNNQQQHSPEGKNGKVKWTSEPRKKQNNFDKNFLAVANKNTTISSGQSHVSRWDWQMDWRCTRKDRECCEKKRCARHVSRRRPAIFIHLIVVVVIQSQFTDGMNIFSFSTLFLSPNVTKYARYPWLLPPT